MSAHELIPVKTIQRPRPVPDPWTEPAPAWHSGGITTEVLPAKLQVQIKAEIDLMVSKVPPLVVDQGFPATGLCERQIVKAYDWGEIPFICTRDSGHLERGEECAPLGPDGRNYLDEPDADEPDDEPETAPERPRDPDTGRFLPADDAKAPEQTPTEETP